MFGRKKKVKKSKVLFVDDDSIVLLSIVRGLQDQPYDILTAGSCKEALEVLEKKKVHVIVTDMCMPEMNGLELIRTIRKEHPDIVGMVLTGYTQDPELRAALENGEVFKLIPKPWQIGGKFERLITQALIRYSSQIEGKHCQTVEK